MKDDYYLNWTDSSSNSDTTFFFLEPVYIEQCPDNCPMKRGNSCLSNKCVKDYPRLEEENQT